MARRFRRPKLRRRKRFRSRRNRRYPTTGFRLSLLGDRQAVRHKFSAFVTLDPGINTIAALIFSANSLFDPQQAGGTHQPLGFDQMTALFNIYTVIGCKIKAEFVNASNDTADRYIVGIYSNESDSSFLVQQYLEGRHSVHGVMQPSGTTRTLTMKTNPPVQMGYPRGTGMLEENLKGSKLLDPIAQLFWHVWAFPAQPTVIGKSHHITTSQLPSPLASLGTSAIMPI